jgi:2-aminoadipate transaminase
VDSIATHGEDAGRWRELYARRLPGMQNDALATLLALAGRHDVISFAGGLPDPATFRADKLGEVARQVMLDAPGVALQYGPTPGLPQTHEWFLSYLARHEGTQTAGRQAVMVTSGGVEALDLLNKILVDPGDVVLMESPSYLGAGMVTASYEGQVVGVPIDEDGLSVDALRATMEELGRRHKRPTFLYTIPDYQNPSGITMSAQRRRDLVALAAESGLLIVEDVAYRRLGFTPEQPPTLCSLNPGGVLLIETFAKTLFPAARIACVAGPAELVDLMTLAKQTTDQCASPLSQAILMEFERRGWLDEQVAHARTVYAERCRTMLDSMQRLLPATTRWTRPRGGFFAWLTLPEHLDSTAMAPAAMDAGIAYVPGQPFFAPTQDGRRYLRLSYSYVALDDVEEGVRRLGEVIAAAVAGRI